MLDSVLDSGSVMYNEYRFFPLDIAWSRLPSRLQDAVIEKTIRTASFIMKKKQLTLSGLALETGSTRQNIRKWLTDEDLLKKGKITAGTHQACIDCIREHQRARSPQAIDPATGLTWTQSSKREETLLRRLEREVIERKSANEWLTAEYHLQILRNLVDRIELVPGRLKSQLGLNEAQKQAIQKTLDDIREEFVKDKFNRPGGMFELTPEERAIIAVGTV